MLEVTECTCKVRFLVCEDGEEAKSSGVVEKWDPNCPGHSKATVILFRESGKYYTQERWAIPKDAILPNDMERSPDFRRIGDGPVLVIEQDPWGFPALLMKA